MPAPVDTTWTGILFSPKAKDSSLTSTNILPNTGDDCVRTTLHLSPLDYFAMLSLFQNLRFPF